MYSSSKPTHRSPRRFLEALPRNPVTRLALSLRWIPMRLFESLFHTKWTRERVSWTIAYVYTLYVALSAVPPFRDTPVFSVAAASVLLVFLYIFHSYTNLDLKTASKFLVIAATISFLWARPEFRLVPTSTRAPSDHSWGRYRSSSHYSGARLATSA